MKRREDGWDFWHLLLERKQILSFQLQALKEPGITSKWNGMQGKETGLTFSCIAAALITVD